MYCLNEVNKNKCGKCKYDLLSYSFVCNKPLIQIARIATTISWLDVFDDSNDTSKSISSAFITCTDKVMIIKLNESDTFIDISIAKYICYIC